MKLKFIFIFICIALFANAQERELVDGLGFTSCFSSIKEGNFNGQINGIMNITHINGDSLAFSFKSNNVLLSVTHDIDEVYDISAKMYKFQSNDRNLQIEYSTYASANSLKIQLNGETFLKGGIDGACDLVINGLSYEYTTIRNSEYLMLWFTKDVGLRPNGNCKLPALYIRRGSMLMIEISR